MHKHYLLQQSLLLALLSALSFSCKSSPTGPHIGRNLQLSSDYVTCREVWLKVAYSGQRSAVGSEEFRVTRDGDTVLTGSLSSTDTLVIDTTAQPEMAYTYKAYRIVNNEVSDTSLPIQVSTMDSTSNNWTFESWTFGSGNGSMFNDAAVINDALAYAVGGVYLNDSTGQLDPQPYNVAVWDGNAWKLEKLDYSGFPPVIRSVFATSESNVWLDPLFRWDGQKFQQIPLDTIFAGVRVDKMWANSVDLYVAGDNGFIARYNGYTWNKIPSAITSTVNDVWGVSTGPTPTVFAVGLTQGIFALTANSATSALNWLGGDAGSIWFADTSQIYVGGDGVYTKDVRGWRRIYYRSGMYVNGIRGSGPNNIFAVG